MFKKMYVSTPPHHFHIVCMPPILLTSVTNCAPIPLLTFVTKCTPILQLSFVTKCALILIPFVTKCAPILLLTFVPGGVVYVLRDGLGPLRPPEDIGLEQAAEEGLG